MTVVVMGMIWPAVGSRESVLILADVLRRDGLIEHRLRNEQRESGLSYVWRNLTVMVEKREW